MTQTPDLYTAERSDLMIRRELDGLVLIYHRPSTLTHILASPAPEILDALGTDRLSVESILERLGAQFDLFADQDLGVIVSARLEELAAIGLARRG